MLDGSGIYKVARQRAEEMLGSQVQHPFGPDWEVFKVRGKIFLLLTAVTGQQQMIIKAEPEDCRFGVVGTASLRSWYRCSAYPVLQGVFFHS